MTDNIINKNAIGESHANDKTLRFERFKAEILRWKGEHREEYNRFARSMDNGDERLYLEIFKAVATQSRKTIKSLELCWDDDSKKDFGEVNMAFNEDALPAEIVDDFHKRKEQPLTEGNTDAKGDGFLPALVRRIFKKRKAAKVGISAPLVLSWLFYGKSFESMARMTATLGRQTTNTVDRRNCSLACRSVIRASVRLGYRTMEDWDRFFAMEKAIAEGKVEDWALTEVRKEMREEVKEKEEEKEKVEETELPEPQTTVPDDEPVVNEGCGEKEEENRSPGRQRSRDRKLSEYIDHECGEEIIDVVRRFIIHNNTGNGLAMPYFALLELGLFDGPLSVTEYSNAIFRQFEDIENLKSHSSCRQALGAMLRPQPIILGGKNATGSLLESDIYAPIYKKLKEDIRTVMRKHGKMAMTARLSSSIA